MPAEATLALHELMDELQSLRELHSKEIAETRQKAVEEQRRLKEWFSSQLAPDLLAAEAERTAAAHAQALAATKPAGSERLALQNALAGAKRRASAAVDERDRALASAREAAEAREADLRGQLRKAKSDSAKALGIAAKAIDDAQHKGEEAAEALRAEVSSLAQALRTAEQRANKAEERIKKLSAENAALKGEIRTSEAKADAMRARLASRMTAASNAAAATPRRSNSSSSEIKAQQRAAAPTAAAKH